MGERPTEHGQLGLLLSATLNAVVPLNGAGGVTMYCTATASGAGTVEALLNNGTTWEQIECWQYDQSGHTMTRRAPGTSITFEERDILFIPSQGYLKVRFLRSAGTATLDCKTCESVLDDIISQLSLTIGTISPGSGATNLGKLEDAAHASGDLGVMGLTVRKDTAAALAGTDGDYAPAETDGKGRLWTMFPVFATVATGEVAGSANSTTPTVCPTVAGPLIVKLKASYDNAGRVYIGGSAVTIANGATDTTTGLQLSAGEETPW